MPKLELSSIPATNRTGYLPPHDQPVQGRWYRRLGAAAGLEDFGVTEATLAPGAWSSQRHWHEGEDEFVVVLEGEAVLVEDEGRTLLSAGDMAFFAKGVPNGHHLINESDAPCRLLAIGRPGTTDCHYPDIDMHLDGPTGKFRRKSE